MTLAEISRSRRRWHLVLYLVALCAAATKGSVLITHPQDLVVDEGSIAVFTCAVQCRYTIYWSVGSQNVYTRTITINDQSRIETFRETTGIDAELVSIHSDCDNNDGNRTQQLRINATAAENETAVQCLAADLTSGGDILFSRYAVLIVQGETPEPIPCPSPEPVIMTSVVTEEPKTSTVTVTVTPSPVTVTKVATITTGLPSETPCPSLSTPTCNTASTAAAVSRLFSLMALIVLPLLVAALVY